MKRYILYIGILLCTLMSCTDEDWVKDGWVSDREVWATLKFGHASFEKIDISTRATLNEIAESRVENLFVYVFDAQGNRLYSHFYDYTNRKETLPTVPGNWWTVKNRTSTNNNDTEGEIMIKAPVMTGGSIYVIANLNADQLNISADQLNIVGTLEELGKLTITMNQEITSRTGYFLMTGSVDGVSVDDKGNIRKGNASVTVPLVRLDAKVTVNVQVGEATQEGQEMQDFIPESWQIMKLPKGTRLLPANNEDADELGYFDSSAQHFEVDNDGVKSFSFYMLENMENTTGLTSYNQRDLRKKKNDGTYDTSNGLWEHASEDATYMVLKGKVQMEVDTDEEFGMQYLEADVTYYIHLGNFGNSTGGGSYNDFTINRNTHYTYNIIIKGVNNIEVEVTEDEENQSGATGHVYKSREEIYTFDAHYGQRVFRIDAESVLDKTVTWYVKTPFSEGTPGMESGTQIPNLDYRWVWFMVNDTEYNGVYSARNRAYPGDKYQAVNYDANDKLMNVVEFTNFIRDEKQKWKDAPEDAKATASAFKKDNSGVYCLYVTAFVDEFYYEADPLNEDNAPQDLWKKFVNQPNRIMHILCDSEMSKDGESSVTNSVITIRQHSIQTPYNIEKAGLMTAWGCESMDEKTSNYGFYSTDESVTRAPANYAFLNNDSPDNGLYNTIGLWELNDGNGTMKSDIRWDTYLDYNRENGYRNLWMKDNYAIMRWSTMMRNRDNNGNGVIDPEEIRWYQASTNQLLGLYIGELGISKEARLYNTNYAVDGYTDGYRTFRRHVLSSTKCSENNSVLDFWTEQGIVTTKYRIDYHENYGQAFRPHLSVRCVRNLGMDNPTAQNIVDKTQNIPQPLVVMECLSNEGTANAVYRFDLSNVNEESFRFYTSKELFPADEFSMSSRPYRGFITGGYTLIEQKNGTVTTFNDYTNLKNSLENNDSPVKEETFRVPNIREAALMTLYIKNNNWWGNDATMVSTYTGLGQTAIGGLGLENGNSWCFGGNNYIVQNENVYGGKRVIIRHVKDWNPSNE